MYNPVSTYRIQFNKDYTFRKFINDIEYLDLLGVSTVYASPVFSAAPGSMHGYDVTDPHSFNPEIGTPEEFSEISRRLKDLNIGWIQDIVPNHMAFHMNNKRLWDVLENGTRSSFYGYFDIDFSHPSSKGKILIPFLGKELKEALAGKEIKLEWMNGRFIFRYYDYTFPLNHESVKQLFLINSETVPTVFLGLYDRYTENNPDSASLEELSSVSDDLHEKSPDLREYINEIITYANAGNDILLKLLNDQHYQLCYWRDSDNVMNYRRFFTVTSLICLAMEDDNVFDEYHTFIRSLVNDNLVNGIRVDHVDGLKLPVRYLEKLRLLCGDDAYIVIEKILEKDEEMITGIPIQGTSGYDFLGIVNNVFTDYRNYHKFNKFYKQISEIKDDPEDIIYEKKKLILTKHMKGELDNLVRILDNYNLGVYDEEVTRETMREALSEFLILFPVYKLYSANFPVAPGETRILSDVFEKSVKKNPLIYKSIDVLRNIFISHDGFSEEQTEKARLFFLRCMQFTGPLMAKGVEDTVMYYYNCFIGHNEVGDSPAAQGIDAETFHKKMIRRHRNFPLSMNATSTHDTKRGEDVRARLNVLSEMPEEWIRIVKSWMKLNNSLKSELNDRLVPDVNEEYFIYQTLTGVFPFNGVADETFITRLDEYFLKSLKEAKLNTGWDNPDTRYEDAVLEFVHKILAPGSGFMLTFIPFQQRISGFGIINSLSQLTLKAMCPGIPDFYQGTELWDLSMVDPDNRRPVDFASHKEMLKKIAFVSSEEPESLFQDLFLTRSDGRIKLWMTHILMEERKAESELFVLGKYIPLQTEGRYKDHILAFARTYENKWYIVIIPLFLSVMPENELREEPGFITWEDTAVVLPDRAPRAWKAFNGRKEMVTTDRLMLADVMKIPSPFFLKGERKKATRNAGVLAHISSLPGKYGTGDLGSEAYRFADVLYKSGQSLWQILPFNPIDKGYSFSPYSSISAFAGNTMFINPDFLIKYRFLYERMAGEKNFRETEKTVFSKAIELRNNMIDKAYSNFISYERPYYRKSFNDFCENQRYWLDDYALFRILKKEFSQVPWIKWPDKIRDRDKSTLKKLSEKYFFEMNREKFGQYLFQLQWIALKNYCNHSGIKIIGDMSFYVNFDSVELWSHPKYFKLDAGKNPFLVAGVPPDFFSSDGQLWNMPVYNWATMKRDGYDWWIRRIRRNLELCDIVRFDHFRGFSEFWEVPFGETTAINGKWTEGPATDFFDKVRKEFPSMPFIAEDLGDIDEKVYKLRDDYSLPGMAVLQFAFGDNTPESIYIPHNHQYNSVVYTGTHDNNTTKGWYNDELNDKNRKEAEEYIGHQIEKDTCNEDFIRMAYSSVARSAIIPIQDILGLDSSARLNKPSTSDKNWDWKMRYCNLEQIDTSKLRRMAILFGRI
jgi:malto-oligosyltrehalose synthase/4-alpha-glucanotransferase